MTVSSSPSSNRWSMKRNCFQPACGQAVRVTTPILYMGFFKSRSGGTHKGVGFDCPHCQARNEFSASFLPRGVINTLPDETAWRAAEASAAQEPASNILPMWVTGQPALNMLQTDIARAQSAGGDILVLVKSPVIGYSFHAPQAENLQPEAILDYLDRVGCELLVVTAHNPDGSAWKTIFHPVSGAASMAVEPA